MSQFCGEDGRALCIRLQYENRLPSGRSRKPSDHKERIRAASDAMKRPVVSTPPAARSPRKLVRPSQWDPDAEEPEAPVVVVLVVDRLYPVAVVVERLVIEPTLVDTAPAQVGRRRPPLRPARASVMVGPTTEIARPAPPGTTWATVSRSARPGLGSCRTAARTAGDRRAGPPRSRHPR